MDYRQRQPKEVLKEINRAGSWDTIGLYRSILLVTLPYEDAKPWLKPEVQPEEWEEDRKVLHKLDEYFRNDVLPTWKRDIETVQPVPCFSAVMQCLATKFLLSHDDWHTMPGINGSLAETGLFGAKLYELVAAQVETGEWDHLTQVGGLHVKPASA